MANEEKSCLFDINKYPETARYIAKHDTCSLRCPNCNGILLRSDKSEKEYLCPSCGKTHNKDTAISGGFHSIAEFNELCNNTRGLFMLDDNTKQPVKNTDVKLSLYDCVKLCGLNRKSILFLVKESESKKLRNNDTPANTIIKYYYALPYIYEMNSLKKLSCINTYPIKSNNSDDNGVTTMFVIPDDVSEKTLSDMYFDSYSITYDKIKPAISFVKPPKDDKRDILDELEFFSSHENFIFCIASKTNIKTLTNPNPDPNDHAEYWINTVEKYKRVHGKNTMIKALRGLLFAIRVNESKPIPTLMFEIADEDMNPFKFLMMGFTAVEAVQS